MFRNGARPAWERLLKHGEQAARADGVNHEGDDAAATAARVAQDRVTSDVRTGQ